MKTKNIYADPTVDFAFKRIFGTERFKAATVGLLNSVIKDVNIVDVTFLNTEVAPENKDDKKCVIDVLAADDQGNNFIVEMQNAKQATFLQRMVYYTAKVIARLEGVVGSEEYDLHATYAIAFLNFPSEAITGVGGRYDLHYRTVEEASGHRLPSSPEYHFFDLDAFKKSSKGMTDGTDFWLSLLTGSKEMDRMPEWARGNEAFEAYFEASARANFTPEETIQYEKDMMTERDRINSINYARWEGVQEGMQKGKQEGIQEGMRQKQDEIAKALKAKGIDAETIAACTGLSVEEIKVL